MLGGYLVTNAWGRPLEFRLTTAVQPNKVQQILYGPTLAEYVHADLIGKTLVEKTATQPTLIVTDNPAVLDLRSRVNIPVVSLVAPPGPEEAIALKHPRASVSLYFSSAFPDDRAAIEARLDKIDPAVDLAEPFSRIKDAIAEARKMGVTSRAA
ncbi:hypothetical protein FRUB_09877 [Fimbriiglobus ruber]|uniref:Uncharacterized protein n=1 Tax=Fimbriiglobus ruber TaxID=1908690 RepID=A0A225DF64_9BACT|nr:hypothetical protein FRUB_09877 [Fimbriiglobus ruber]